MRVRLSPTAPCTLMSEANCRQNKYMNDTKPTQNHETETTMEITPAEALTSVLPDGGLVFNSATDRFEFHTDKRIARLMAMKLYIALQDIEEPESVTAKDIWVSFFNESQIYDIRFDGNFAYGESYDSSQQSFVIYERDPAIGISSMEKYKGKLEKILNITFDEKGISHPASTQITSATSLTFPPQKQ